jgi:hypothetical protein
MSQEEYVQELRLYEYSTNDGREGTIAAFSELDAKIRVARRAIVCLPLEIEQCREICSPRLQERQ